MSKDFDVLDKDLKLVDFLPKSSNNIYLFDDKNNKKIDLLSGLIFGYNNKIQEKAILETLNSTILNQNNCFQNENVNFLKKVLYKISGFENNENKKQNYKNNVLFFNSSSEAIENAIKIARKRYNILCDRKYSEIICFNDYDYGNTITTISASNKKNLNIDPMLPGFKFANINDIESVDNLITEDTSAILLPTIIFKNGINKCTIDFLQKIRELCTKHEILLMLDETKYSCGKTGTFFEYIKADIIPDIVCIANDFTGGFDFASCIINDESAKYIDNDNNVINNIYINIAIKFIKILSNEDFLKQIEKLENTIDILFNNLIAYDKIITKIDIYGLFCVLSLNENIDNTKLAKILFSNGIIVECINDNCLKLNFPSICTKKQIEQIVEIIKISIEEVYIIERY